MKEAIAGSDPALSDLLSSVRPLVYRWAEGRTGDPDAAEDIAQSVLVRLLDFRIDGQRLRAVVSLLRTAEGAA